MILQSLANKSKKVAETVLVELTGGFLPSPNEAADLNPFEPIEYSDVLKEIREKIGLKEDDRSDNAKTKILEVLSNELTSLYLNESKIFQLRTRSEHRKLGSQNRFLIKIDDKFALFESTGITKNEIKQAIESPDEIEYVQDNFGYAGQRLEFGLSLKRRVNESTGAHYDFLAIFSRTEEIVEFIAAWRVFDDDLGYTSETKPLAIFFKFIDKYAYRISAGKSPETKLIVAEVWNFNFDRFEDFFKIYDVKEGEEFYNSMSLRRTPLGLINANLVYVINITKYRKLLVQRGFPQQR